MCNARGEQDGCAHDRKTALQAKQATIKHTWNSRSEIGKQTAVNYLGKRTVRVRTSSFSGLDTHLAQWLLCCLIETDSGKTGLHVKTAGILPHASSARPKLHAGCNEAGCNEMCVREANAVGIESMRLDHVAHFTQFRYMNLPERFHQGKGSIAGFERAECA